MFESFSRGLRMIWASIKMGWADKRLMIPSILTVFTNIFFGMIMLVQGSAAVTHQPHATPQTLYKEAAAEIRTVKLPSADGMQGMPTHGFLPGGPMPGAASVRRTIDMTHLNNSDQGPFSQISNGVGDFLKDGGTICAALGMIWWLTNRFLEGVTTALVYSHLTQGKGTGRFSDAVKAVFASLPAIVMLGIVTWVARRLATFMRNKRSNGVLGLSLGFVAGVIEVFWTLAGHLILPAIIIEGSSFWGGFKRADKIAQGNLLTIGIGEVGVDGICKLCTYVLYGVGMAGLGAGFYAQTQMHIVLNQASIAFFGVIWIAAVVVATALSIYIRAAFYTCLYVWAIESEAVEEGERTSVRPPEPLALALA